MTFRPPQANMMARSQANLGPDVSGYLDIWLKPKAKARTTSRVSGNKVGGWCWATGKGRGAGGGEGMGGRGWRREENPPTLLPLTLEVVLALAFGFSQMSRYPLTSGPKLAWDLDLALAWLGVWTSNLLRRAPDCSKGIQQLEP